jgi:DNA-binding protein Fis
MRPWSKVANSGIIPVDMAEDDPVDVAASPGVLPPRSLEEVIFERLAPLLSRLQGQRVPKLHRLVLDQAERALFRAALAESGGHVSRAAAMLDLDRTSLARRARALGVEIQGRPGPKPRRARKPR